MAETQRDRRDELDRKKRDTFKGNALLIIKAVVKLCPEHPSKLVDEILHSIFFLGRFNRPPCAPGEIISDNEMLKELEDYYPGPFKYCSSRVPRRSPISCVLELIVCLKGQNQEDEIIKLMKELSENLKQAKKKCLNSFTICVSRKNADPDSVRYYGVSMSTSGALQGQIMIAASCLSIWDRSIADAVMTYYPGEVKKDYFDGTIILPEEVICQALSIRTRREMPPCRSCGNMFGLNTQQNGVNDYGNCAEVESLSNLLKNEPEVRQRTIPTRPDLCTDDGRQRATQCACNNLTDYLRKVPFRWDGTFYTPQEVEGENRIQ